MPDLHAHTQSQAWVPHTSLGPSNAAAPSSRSPRGLTPPPHASPQPLRDPRQQGREPLLPDPAGPRAPQVLHEGAGESISCCGARRAVGGCCCRAAGGSPVPWLHLTTLDAYSLPSPPRTPSRHPPALGANRDAPARPTQTCPGIFLPPCSLSRAARGPGLCSHPRRTWASKPRR